MDANKKGIEKIKIIAQDINFRIPNPNKIQTKRKEFSFFFKKKAHTPAQAK